MNLFAHLSKPPVAGSIAGAALNAILRLPVICLLWAALPALAQESDQKFSLYTAEGVLVGVYETQQQAEAAIKNIPGPAWAPTVYQYVKEIKETKLAGNGEVAITYWIGAHQPSDPDWQYKLNINSGSVKYSTEEEAVVAWKAALNQKAPNCPAAANAVPDGEWFASYQGMENMQDRWYFETRISRRSL